MMCTLFLSYDSNQHKSNFSLEGNHGGPRFSKNACFSIIQNFTYPFQILKIIPFYSETRSILQNSLFVIISEQGKDKEI